MTPRINEKRLWNDLMELGKIGYSKGMGVTRNALSKSDLEAKAWLKNTMLSIGLDVRTDEAFNQIGLLNKSNKKNEKIMALGSHLDTVTQGGMFDGSLGVVGALECARIIKENNILLPSPLEVINFCDEEAFHLAGTVGSRAMLGLLKENEIYQSKTEGRNSFAEDLMINGKEPDKIQNAFRAPKDFAFFLELHIEQGKFLESMSTQIGCVTGISGIYRYFITVKGKAEHAGTTPMNMRKDALVIAAPLFSLLPEWLNKQNPDMVGTIGQVHIQPGSVNVVPGLCQFIIELRSQNIDDIIAIRRKLEQYANGRDWTIESVYEKNSTLLNKEIISQIEFAALREDYSCLQITSGAGHDAQSFAEANVNTGMIFTPCRNGVSHSPEEWITQKQAAQGCQVLLNTILQLSKLD